MSPPEPVARLTAGITLLAVAAVGYLFAALAYGADRAQLVGLALLLSGLLLAGAGQAAYGRGAAPALGGGLAVAAAGALLWLGPTLVQGNLAGLAASLFAGGLLLAAVDTARAGPAADAESALGRGLALTAVGALLWVPSDFLAQAALWQPGNFLAALGAVLAGGFRRTPSYDEAARPPPDGVKGGAVP